MQSRWYAWQRLIARVCVYAACWLGFGFGLYWVWEGILNLQPHSIWNRYVNPLLLVIGLIVWAACYGLYKMNRTVAVLLVLYALIQEILLQHYTVQHYGHIIFKPYFPAEIIGLVLGAGGVFWYHWAANQIKKTNKP